MQPCHLHQALFGETNAVTVRWVALHILLWCLCSETRPVSYCSTETEQINCKVQWRLVRSSEILGPKVWSNGFLRNERSFCWGLPHTGRKGAVFPNELHLWFLWTPHTEVLLSFCVSLKERWGSFITLRNKRADLAV